MCVYVCVVSIWKQLYFGIGTSRQCYGQSIVYSGFSPQEHCWCMCVCVFLLVLLKGRTQKLSSEKEGTEPSSSSLILGDRDPSFMSMLSFPFLSLRNGACFSWKPILPWIQSVIIRRMRCKNMCRSLRTLKLKTSLGGRVTTLYVPLAGSPEAGLSQLGLPSSFPGPSSGPSGKTAIV